MFYVVENVIYYRGMLYITENITEILYITEKNVLCCRECYILQRI